MAGYAGGTMLNRGIRASYVQGLEKLASRKNVVTHVPGICEPGPGQSSAAAALFQSDVKTFLEDPILSEEVFGPATLLLAYDSREDLLAFIDALQGQLTSAVHGNDEDMHTYADLIARLETKAGRIIFNGFPTGVEVCPSMVHGGPWPATTDSRFTAVGTAAIYRFVRPVCYQSFPETLLPPELQSGNPLGLARLVDGKREPRD
jgi:NADP-dependent aldehyde dehydrogenase